MWILREKVWTLPQDLCTRPQRFREEFCKAQEGSKPIEYAYTMLTLYMYFACSYIYEETSHGLYRLPALVADPSCVRLRETERKLTGRFIVSHGLRLVGDRASAMSQRMYRISTRPLSMDHIQARIMRDAKGNL
jgi:hypothetical protein